VIFETFFSKSKIASANITYFITLSNIWHGTPQLCEVYELSAKINQSTESIDRQAKSFSYCSWVPADFRVFFIIDKTKIYGCFFSIKEVLRFQLIPYLTNNSKR